MFKLFLLTLVVAIFTFQCDIRYGIEGDNCRFNTTERCKVFHTCHDNKCKLSTIGSVCEKKEDCYHNELGVECIRNKCTKKRYSGFDCTHNDECFTGSCIQNRCVGLVENDPCDPAKLVQCSKGLYCSFKQKKCVKQLQRSERCDDYDHTVDIYRGSNYNVLCPGGTKCVNVNRGNSTCTPVFYKNEGATCSFLEECSAPLQCVENRCINVPQTIPCGSSKCNVDEDCQCGKCVKQMNLNECYYADTFKEWRNCWEQYNCPYDQGLLYQDWFTDSFYQAGTCLATHCGHIARKFLCCAMVNQKDSSHSYAYLPSSLQCPRSESQVILVATLLIGSFCMLGCAAVIFGLIGLTLFKRNRGYEELK